MVGFWVGRGGQRERGQGKGTGMGWAGRLGWAGLGWAGSWVCGFVGRSRVRVGELSRERHAKGSRLVG